MVTDERNELVKRLASIEGHVHGIRKMVEDETDCVDVMKQTFAVERALQRFETELLRGHLATCVPRGYKDGRDDQMVEELTGLFLIAKR